MLNLFTYAAPVGMVVDRKGDLFFGDLANERIRKVAGGIITTVAGNGSYLYSGDGGPAVSAAINTSSIATDAAGNIFFIDGSYRIREITNGVVNTVIGNGTTSFSGDGGPATSAGIGTGVLGTIGPQGIAFDSVGNIFFGDGVRVRKVSDGIITTVAGNGRVGFSGDGGPATSAEVFAVPAVAVDDAGNLFIADEAAQRIRKVTNGVITTFAGSIECPPTGAACPGSYAGDGGPATSAWLNGPTGLAVGNAQNLFILDTQNGVIRNVSNGIITTFAGNGQQAGEGVPARGAAISRPWGIAVDSAGNVYYSDDGTGRVRKISNGGVNTIAGGSTDTGDGELAVVAQLSPLGIAVDPAGNVLIADGESARIRAVLAQPPILQLSPPSISLTAASGGAPVTASMTISATAATSNWLAVPGMPYTVQFTGGYSWLSIAPQSGTTPGLITITADPSGLPPGIYPANFNLLVANTNSPLTLVNLQFTVTAPIPASLSVDHSHLSFTYSNTSAPRRQTIAVSNTGGGSLPFAASITPNPGQSASWLSVTPGSGAAIPGAPAVLTVEADPAGLAAGTYSANIVITSAAGSATVSVTMTISTNPLIMLLSQTGFTFTAVQNGGAVPPQTFSVLNLGSGTLNWTAQTSVLGGVNNWLVATPTNGASSAAASSTAPVVTVSVNPGNLAPGVYYGLVTITAPGAANTPQGVVAVLQVLPAGTDLAPVVQPTSLAFTGAAGDSSPGSQNVAVYDPTGTGKSFRSGIVTASGGSWLVTLPSDATIPSNSPVNVVVQPIVNGLAPGTYQGTLTLQFSDGRVSTVAIQFVVTGAGAHARPTDANGPCMSNTLTPSLLTLGSGFSVPAGYPQGLEAQVFDNCGAPQVDGTVFVQFSNGDAPVKLQSLGNGVWDGTWPVGSTPASVTLTVAAQNAAAVKGQNQINGGLSAAMPSPMVFNGGVVNSAGLSGQTVSPGELISIFGQQLSGGASPAGSGQLPFSLAATAVAIGSQSEAAGGTFQALPLYYASGGLVNAVVPYAASVNTNQQILLEWGTAYAPPVYVDVAAAAPQVFQLAAQQGVITDLNYNVIGPNNPAHAGQVIVIYCSGLGAVNPAVADGAGSSGLSYAQSPVTVTIGGQTTATPGYAGLTPGVAGLYQINVAVPQGVAPGDSVPVSVTVAGQTSGQVFTSVR